MKDHGKSKEQLTDELVKLRQQVGKYKGIITDNDRALEVIQHFNSILSTISNVNQLIIREKNRESLLKGICDTLTENRGYHNAWVVLLDEAEKIVTITESGLGESFLPMLNRLKKSEFPSCSRKAMMQSEIEIIEDPFSTCTDCPLSKKYKERGGMTTRLEYNGRVYGILTVSVPRIVISNEKEHFLFKELAENICFALHNIELKEDRNRIQKALQIAYEESEMRVEERTVEFAKLNKELQGEIAGHKQTEEALRKSEKKYRKLYDETNKTAEVYRSLLHTSADAIIIYDMERKVRYINPSFTNIFGWTIKEIESKRIPFLPESEKEATIALIKEIARKGKAIQSFETKRYTKDGRVIDVIISGSRYNDHRGKPSGMLFILRSISEQKKLEAQLQHAQKMEAIGTLAGGIAHDFNNILQTISGYVQILLMEKEPGDPTRYNLEAIKKSAQRATDLTKQLMIFGRKVKSKLTPVDLNLEIQPVAKILERTILKMINIQLYLAEDLKIISADPAQLEQIVINLGVNARDAMPDGGTLTFETQSVTLDEEYARLHLGASPGDYVLLSISDTGHGIDKDTLEHIYEPFYTTKALGKGTGLGLAMVYGIVKNHGGYIMCYSEPGQGTIFKIYFPAVNSEVEEQREDKKEDKKIPGGNEIILLVDDEKTILEIGKNILERFGYEITTAQSGEKAVEIFERENDRIDLIILDVGMPGMGGHKCLKELLKIDSKVKVIISSGYSPNGKVKETLETGASGFIGKPYQFADMLKKVRKVLDNGYP